MKKIEKLEKKYNSLVYNHIWLKYILEYGFALLATFISAAIFALGVNTFIQPATALGGDASGIVSFVSSGSSGAAQVIDMIFILCGVKSTGSLIFSLSYLLINVPLIILAFKGVGKRFGVFTTINVVLVFVLTNFFKFDFMVELAVAINNNGGAIARALFAGMCTGLSSAIAFKIDASAGGFDIVSYYISIKKSTLAGKYNAIINGIVIVAYAMLSSIGNSFAFGLEGICYSLIYIISVMIVVDVINIRNKKAQIQIITTNKELPKLLLANIPHGATLVNATGVYSESDRLIVYIVVSTTEVRKAVKIIKQLDPTSFVSVTALSQVYGNFHMKSIK